MRAAEFESACAECEGRIAVGEMIEVRGGEWVHVECPDPITGLPQGPGARICARCGLIHPGEC